MKTINVVVNRYVHGQDTYVDIVYRGKGWSISENKDYPILSIYGEDSMIASHRQWESVKFTDDLVSETVN